MTSFVGRHQEIDDLLALLDRSDVRLITLTGPGGVGKTRLALRVAEEWARRTGAVTVFVSLAPIAEPAHVAPAIGNAFGLMDSPSQFLADRLAAVLAGQAVLLVLDNLEHVVEITPVLTDLLAASPSLKVLATSRSILRLSAEHEYPVQPLDLPDPESAVNAIGHASAVQLFLERAHIQADSLRDDQLASIVDICLRLDGLPLAIELAAAKSRLFSPKDLLLRLDQRLPLLTGGPRDAPARLQTMRDAIAWSHDLLDQDNRRLFRSLSVFSGEFTLDAVAAISDAESASEVIDGIASLLDRSLIQRIDDDSGSTRFMMLETVREFGREQLVASNEFANAQERHAKWFADLVPFPGHEAWDDARIPQVPALANESENLRLALSWGLDQGRALTATHLALGLGPFWWEHGLYTEARAALDRLLEGAGLLDPKVRIFLMGWASEWAWLQSDYPDSERRADEAMQLGRELNHQPGIAANLFRLGRIAVLHDPENAEKMFREALSTSRRIGEPRTVVFALIGMGFIMFRTGRIEEAKSHWSEARRVIARFEVNQRDPMLQRLAIWEGQAAQKEGNLDLADQKFNECLTISRKVSNVFRELIACFLLGQINLDQGNLAMAAIHTGDAFKISQRLGTPFRIAQSLTQMACVAEASGDFRRAAVLLGAESALRERLALIASFDYFEPRVPERESIAVALGDNAFADAWEAGRSMSIAEVTEEATALIAVHQAGARESGILSRREIEVLALVAEGKSNRDIADTLFLSHRTVEAHMASILTKLGVATRHLAVQAARERGLIAHQL